MINKIKISFVFDACEGHKQGSWVGGPRSVSFFSFCSFSPMSASFGRVGLGGFASCASILFRSFALLTRLSFLYLSLVLTRADHAMSGVGSRWGYSLIMCMYIYIFFFELELRINSLYDPRRSQGATK